MSQNQDIRDWALSQGLDVNLKGPVRREVRDKWSARDDSMPGTGPAAEGAPAAPPGPAEPAPSDGRPWWKRKKISPRDHSVSPARRVSLEPLVTTAWGLAAKALEARMLPVARVLQMQAPVAGMVIDDTAKGTVADAVLQPFARAGEKGERVFALVGPPLLTAVICKNPDIYPMARPILKTSIMLWMEVAEPAMKKAERRAKQFEEKFGGVDIDAMLDALFQPPAGWVQYPDGTYGPPEEQPEPERTAA